MATCKLSAKIYVTMASGRSLSEGIREQGVGAGICCVAEEKCNKSCGSYSVPVLVLSPSNLWARMSVHTQKVKQSATEVRQQRCQIRVGVAAGGREQATVVESCSWRDNRKQALQCNF